MAERTDRVPSSKPGITGEGASLGREMVIQFGFLGREVRAGVEAFAVLLVNPGGMNRAIVRLQEQETGRWRAGTGRLAAASG